MNQHSSFIELSSTDWEAYLADLLGRQQTGRARREALTYLKHVLENDAVVVRTYVKDQRKRRKEITAKITELSHTNIYPLFNTAALSVANLLTNMTQDNNSLFVKGYTFASLLDVSGEGDDEDIDLKYGGSLTVRQGKPIPNHSLNAPVEQRNTSDIMREMARTLQPHPVDLTMRNHQTVMYESKTSDQMYNHLMQNASGSVHNDTPDVKQSITHMLGAYPRLKAAYHRGFHPVQKRVNTRPKVERKNSRVTIDYGRAIDLPTYFGNGSPLSNHHHSVREFHLS